VPDGVLSLTCSLNIGLSTSIGADIDIEVDGYTVLTANVGPYTVWNHKFSIWERCVVLDSQLAPQLAIAAPGALPVAPIVSVRDHGRAMGGAAARAWQLPPFRPSRARNATAGAGNALVSLRGSAPAGKVQVQPAHTAMARRAQTAPTAIFLGSTWSGQQVRVSNDPSCVSSFPATADIFVQGVPTSEQQQVLIAISGLFESLGYCTMQLLYTVASGNGAGVLTFDPAEDDNGGYQLGFFQCAYTGDQALQPLSSDFQVSSDYNTLTAFGGSDCIETVLTRAV
jgi:hypothetical protein